MRTRQVLLLRQQKAELLGYAYVLEQATEARVPPRLSVTPRG